MSTPLLKSSMQEDPSSWCLLGFIPDHGKTSSTKNQQEAQQKYEKGRNQCNYHSFLKEILKPVEQSMNQGGLNDYVHQVDELWYLEIVPVLVMTQGDSKSGDTLVSWFSGMNCKGRVSRLCMTPFKHLSNPMHCLFSACPQQSSTWATVPIHQWGFVKGWTRDAIRARSRRTNWGEWTTALAEEQLHARNWFMVER
jgi:hypothetical protein